MPRLTLLILLSLTLAACGGDAAETPKIAATATPFVEKVTGTPTPLPQATPSALGEPRIAKPKGEPPATLVVRDLAAGKGAAAAPGQTLTVDYKGVLFDTGKAFDSSWSTGRPFTFILGAQQVIKGWEQGIRGMRVGGRRELIIPPQLAYGDHGQGPILPNSTIVFVVDLLAVN